MRPGQIGAVALALGGLLACAGDGCSCADASPDAVRSEHQPSTHVSASETASSETKTSPPPIDMYAKDTMSIEEEFERYVRGILECVKDEPTCPRAAKVGRKMARRALSDARAGKENRLKDLWRLSVARMLDEPLARLRLEITHVLKIAVKGAPDFRASLLELLEDESDPMAAQNLGEMFAGAMAKEDDALKDRLTAYLLRMDATKPGLIDGQIGVWQSLETFIRTEERWLETAHTCLVKTPNRRLQSVLTRIMRYAPDIHHARTTKVLADLMKRRRSSKDLSLVSSTVETLGKLGHARAIDSIEEAVRTRYHQRSFLPSAALGLYHLAQHPESQKDGARIVASAEQILAIPGLSLVAYRYSLYAIRDSGAPTAQALLKAYTKHPDNEARKIAVQALLGVGKLTP